jgi:L-lactate dehydrogenase complex protein LldF
VTTGFRASARTVLADAHTLQALDDGTNRLREGRLRAWGELGDAQELRRRAREIRTRTIAELDAHLERFTREVGARGGAVHRTATAEEAAASVVEICRVANARLVAKSKSMATEEIGLNAALERAGHPRVGSVEGE